MSTPQSDSPIALQGLVKGTVQGVFFRAATQRQAQQLGIHGWVRNTAEGHVEVCIVGTPAQVGEMVLWLQQGPPRALVSAVELAPLPSPAFSDFQILS